MKHLFLGGPLHNQIRELPNPMPVIKVTDESLPDGAFYHRQTFSIGQEIKQVYIHHQVPPLRPDLGLIKLNWNKI